jgi:hypothetical protein
VIWLLALSLATAYGPIDAGVLHDKHGRLVRFKSLEECEMARFALQMLANTQASQGKLNPVFTSAELRCYRPVEA